MLGVLHRSELPAGWASPADLADRIEEAYRGCIELAAYNRVVHLENVRSPTAVGVGANRRLATHPSGVPRDPMAELSRWGADRSAPRQLDEAYRELVVFLRARPLSDLSCWISGKFVLSMLHQAMPQAARGIRLEILLNWYLDKHPAPPTELAGLIDRLIGPASAS